MCVNIQFYPPAKTRPNDILLPQQVHSSNIIEVVSNDQDLSNCDGIWTNNPTLTLGIQTADCVPVCFWDKNAVGVFHAGWRGLVDGIIEKAESLFENPQAWVGPFYHQFEIQPDQCAQKIENKFGTKFFLQQDKKLIFDFKGALASILPYAEIDPRSTFDFRELASWRRDKTALRNITTIKVKSKK